MAERKKKIEGQQEVVKQSFDTGEIRQFLTFVVGEEQYGVDLLKIREIKGWTETTRIPNTPNFMKGVINLRGAVIPIFDLRGRFGMGQTEPTEKNVNVIVAVGKRLLGILVDSVSDIVEIGETELRPAPKMESKIDDEFVNGLISKNDKMIVILNTDNLFNYDDMQLSNNSSNENNSQK